MTLDEALDVVVARTGHERFRQLCNPEHPDYNPTYIPLVLRMAQGETPLPTVESSPRGVQVPWTPDIPLAGDVVEAIAKRIGVDRLAAWWERQTGQPCGCAERRDKLNRATERLLRWLRRV